MPFSVNQSESCEWTWWAAALWRLSKRRLSKVLSQMSQMFGEVEGSKVTLSLGRVDAAGTGACVVLAIGGCCEGMVVAAGMAAEEVAEVEGKKPGGGEKEGAVGSWSAPT